MQAVERSLRVAAERANLNAFITLDAEAARVRAARLDDDPLRVSGPLAGVPIAIKDNIDVRGLRTTAGTPGIDYVASVSAPVVERLEAAGAIVLGKTNLHELAFGVTSINPTFGAVGNPVDPARIPGGSSGGTAAAVGAGIVPAGLGTDTAGSVRVPAALCGIVGFRPTTRSIPSEGVVPSVPTFDVVGPLATTVGDVAVLHSVMSEDDLPAPRSVADLRLGIAIPQSRDLSPRVRTLFDAACAALSSAGASLVPVDLSSIFAASFEVGYPIAYHEMRTRMIAFLAKREPRTSLEELVEAIAGEDVGAVYRESVLGDGAPTEVAYHAALRRLDDIQRDYTARLAAERLDAIAFPTVPLEATRIDETGETVVLNGERVPTVPTFIRNGVSAPVCRAPGLSIPLGLDDDGLPAGIELGGYGGEDVALLGVGLAVEDVLAGVGSA